MRVSAGEGIIYFVRGGCGNIFVFPRRSLVGGPLLMGGRPPLNPALVSAESVIVQPLYTLHQRDR